MVPGCEIGKLKHLIGATKKSLEDDPTFQNWDLEDSAKKVWDTVKSTCPDLKNSAQVFEIRCKLKDTKQGNHRVTQYYTNLQALRQELNLFIEADYCPECTEKQRRSIEKEKMFDFLAGLNKDLDEVWWRILGKEPLPPLDEVFAEVRREKS